MAVVTKTNVANTNTLFHKVLLEAFSLNPVYKQFAVAPSVTGVDSVTFYRVNELEVGDNPAPLVDAVLPNSEDVDIETSKIVLAQYGSYIEYAASVADIQPVDLIGRFTKIIGKMGSTVQEIILQNALLSSTNISYASNVAGRTDVVAVITLDDMHAMYTSLEEEGAPLITSIVPAGDKTNTYPVDACYIAVCTPAQARTIKQLNTFEPKHQYSNPNVAYTGEIGSIAGFRVISANIIQKGVVAGAGSGSITGKKSTSSQCDVHRLIAFGKDAFGCGVGSKGIESIVKTPAQYANALNLVGTTGYKMYFGAEILNADWVSVLETAAVL